jgi:hypothetical protein
MRLLRDVAWSSESWLMSRKAMKMMKPMRPANVIATAAPIVMTTLMIAISRSAERRNTDSTPIIARWPPSSGSTGIRLSRPITGPAHQIARLASDCRTLSPDVGSTPIAASTARLTTICVPGPAIEISARRALLIGRRGWNDV